MNAARKLIATPDMPSVSPAPGVRVMRRGPGLVEASEAHAPVPSPANEIQAMLQQALAEPAVVKWSDRKAMVFLLAVSVAFWAAIAVAVVLIF